MRNLVEYITESTSNPSSFKEMLDEVIKSDDNKVLVASTDDNENIVYIWFSRYYEYLTVQLKFNNPHNTPLFIVKNPKKNKMFKDDSYKTFFIEKLKDSKYASILKKFISDIEDDTTKVCKLMTYKDFSKKYN